MSASQWDRPGVAGGIDNFWATAPGEAYLRQRIMADLRGYLQAGDVLEIGCGSGRIYAALRDSGLLEGRSYRGGDSSHEMLALAREHYPDGHFELMDLLSLDPALADNVLCIQVLQHFEDWRPALRKALGAARKLLYVVTWFGNGQHYYDGNGFWNHWLSFNNFANECRQAGGRVGEPHDLGSAAWGVPVWTAERQ